MKHNQEYLYIPDKVSCNSSLLFLLATSQGGMPASGFWLYSAWVSAAES